MKLSYIPSIYNYCDRWCERCAFTSRCRNFESISKLTPEEQDPENEACWKKIASNMENAMSMLKEMASEQGLDLEAIKAEDNQALKEKDEALEISIQAHPLIILCEKYWKDSKAYFDESSNQTRDARALVNEVALGIKSKEEGLRIAEKISDSVEIIQWYMFFIDAKLQRALRGKLDAEAEYDLYDANGSAKIAILAVEKSISAWKTLYELRETAEDIGIQSLSLLCTIKKKALEEFPKAMEFVRPGFDETIFI